MTNTTPTYLFAPEDVVVQIDDTNVDILYAMRASGPWPFNFGTGSTPLGRQSLAIVSTEQPA